MTIDELENSAEDIKVKRESFVLLKNKKTDERGREMVKLEFTYPPSVRPRKALEVLGRYTVAPKINGEPLLNQRAHTARPCTVGEKLQYGSSCDAYFDHYLVTSYEIRQQDGIETFQQIGSRWLTDAEGNRFPAVPVG
ncbi:MAG: hypothetical protein R2827_05615 [Bdellovibrionales bacterium]